MLIYIRLFCMLGLVLGVMATPRVGAQTLEGYMSSFSAPQGGSISLHVSTDLQSFDGSVINLADQNKKYYEVKAVPGSGYPVQESAYKSGPKWPAAIMIPIGMEWPSGIYALELNGAGKKWLFNFVVRPAAPGSTAAILALDSSTTRVAYNAWGGKSLYPFNSQESLPATEVALARPGQNRLFMFGDPVESAGNRLPDEDVKFMYWAEENGIALEFASIIDLHFDPDLLAYYDVIVITGHNEYWSYEMRQAVDQFVLNGGKVVFLSGNTMWWQVRFSDDSMICYKARDTDPLGQSSEQKKTTVNWFDTPVDWPENTTTGVSYRNGGYVNSQGLLLESDGFGGYTVRASKHEFFAGTGLKNGDQFGQANTIVGYETDGALFEEKGGLPVVSGDDGTPTNFLILATSPAGKIGGG